MTRTVLISLIALFLLGGVIMITASMNYGPIPIVLKTSDSELVIDSVLCDDVQLWLSPPDSIYVSNNVKWRIDDRWYHEDVHENFNLNVGDHEITMYMDGRDRGSRKLIVMSCGAVVDLPKGLSSGEEGVLVDRTPNAISRRWFISGKEMVPEDPNANSLKFKFDKPMSYSVLVKVARSSGDTVNFEDEILVLAPIPKKVVPRPTSPVVKVREEVVKKEPKPVKEVEAPVIEGPKDNGNGFYNMASFEFGSTHVMSYADMPDTSCFEFNGERRTLNLRGLKKDLCLTKIWMIPDAKLKGNRVLVKIQNTNGDFKWQEMSKSVQAGRSGAPSFIDVENIGCGMIKGGSYIISVQAANGSSKFADLDYTNGCLGEVDYGDLLEEIKWRDKTKILKLEFAY